MKIEPKNIDKSASPFPLLIFNIKSLLDLTSLEIPTTHFTLFLAADYTEIGSSEMSELAKRLIDKGLRYVSCWGNQSTLGDNAFDMGNMLWEEENSTALHVMTTWHEELLAEALWFWLYLGTPDDEYWNSCSAVMVNVSSAVHKGELENLIGDIEKLNQKVIATNE